MLEIKYINVHGETLHIVQDKATQKLSMHHSDIHSDEKYEDLIYCLKNYVFNPDEYTVIGTFTELCTSLL
jgi:hypothetical protein